MQRRETSTTVPGVPFSVILVTILATLVTTSIAHAQRSVELTPFAGWMWGGTLEYTGGSIHVEAAPSYGGMLSVGIRPGEYVDLSYWYQGADVINRPTGFQSSKFMELATHYIQIGGSKFYPTGGKAQPFATGGLGMTIFDPSQAPSSVNAETVFSISVGGGVKIDLNEKIALRGQARLLVPMKIWSGGVWFGTGGGGVSISGSAIAQGDATLGLVIKLGS